jgi:hypothetical protein
MNPVTHFNGSDLERLFVVTASPRPCLVPLAVAKESTYPMHTTQPQVPITGVLFKQSLRNSFTRFLSVNSLLSTMKYRLPILSVTLNPSSATTTCVTSSGSLALNFLPLMVVISSIPPSQRRIVLTERIRPKNLASKKAKRPEMTLPNPTITALSHHFSAPDNDIERAAVIPAAPAAARDPKTITTIQVAGEVFRLCSEAMIRATPLGLMISDIHPG